MQSILGIIACFFGTCAAPHTDTIIIKEMSALETSSGSEINRPYYKYFDGKSASGNYLAGRFAQQHHDWSKASDFMDYVLRAEPEDALLIKRAMVIAMGAGDVQKALDLSHKLLKLEPDSSLAHLFIITDDFKRGDFAQAQEDIAQIPASGVSDFVIPVLKSWAMAAQNQYDAGTMKDNNIHVYHAVLIADYLQDYSYLRTVLEQTLKTSNLSGDDLERIADVYAHIGNTDKALTIYEALLKESYNSEDVQTKIAKLKAGEDLGLFQKVETPAQGVAYALYDLAQSLYQEYSDDSARVFAHMVLYLNPGLTEARILLAEIAARHDRHQEAINFYQSIDPTHKDYVSARRRAAALLEDAGRTGEAVRELEKLAMNYKDLEAIIQLGDLYRHEEDFENALVYYNMAISTFPDGIPAEYWHLHYVRGMSYERTGQWTKAEQDLKAALAFQPDHPFVLNYLGYAWADQNIHLDESLAMIRKAVALRPTDGYITDSLGWVLYKMGKYDEAVPHLEQAVELLPYDPVMNDHLGDAYWRAGRKLEARFQWTRAKNNAEDAEMLEKVEQKLAEGLVIDDTLRAASTQPDKTGTRINR